MSFRNQKIYTLNIKYSLYLISISRNVEIRYVRLFEEANVGKVKVVDFFVFFLKISLDKICLHVIFIDSPLLLLVSLASPYLTKCPSLSRHYISTTVHWFYLSLV